MSQYIELPKNFPFQSPAILKGILSKVIEPTSKFSKKRSSSQKRFSHKQYDQFYDSKMDCRYVQEVKIADDLQNIVMDFEYKKMKKKLMNYGKSQHRHVQKIIRLGRQQKYFDSLQTQDNTNSARLSKSRKHSSALKLVEQIQHDQRQAKLRYSIGKIHSQVDSHDRTVFVDRKYNKQFALKFATLKQTEAVNEMKVKYQQFMATNNQLNPLVDQAKTLLKRKKYHTQYEKEPFEAIGLVKTTGNWIRNQYQPRRKERSSYEPVYFQDKIEKTQQIQIKISKNKQKKALSCDFKINLKDQQIKSDKQNQVRCQYSPNIESKPKQFRKRQRKITWEKQAKI